MDKQLAVVEKTNEHDKFGSSSIDVAAFELPAHVQEQVERGEVQFFNAAWDAEGVYFYQAYRKEIADYAVENQRFGGSAWKPIRMTWIKPSFAWMLYRAGYGKKPGQERVLRIKLAHKTVAEILRRCALSTHVPEQDGPVVRTRSTHGNGGESGSGGGESASRDGGGVVGNGALPSSSCSESLSESKKRFVEEGDELNAPCDRSSEAAAAPECESDSKSKQANHENKKGSGGSGRVQWDPERDLFSSKDGKGKEPRPMLRTRAIQIGISGCVSEFYVDHALSIEDVTSLAHAVYDAHREKTPVGVRAKIAALAGEKGPKLLEERPYMPDCASEDLRRLGMLSGPAASRLARLGRGKAT